MPQDFKDQIRQAKLAAEQAANEKALQEKLWEEKKAQQTKAAVPLFERLASKILEKARELTSTLHEVTVEFDPLDGNGGIKKKCMISIIYKQTVNARGFHEWCYRTSISIELDFIGYSCTPESINRFSIRDGSSKYIGKYRFNITHVLDESEEEILAKCEAHLQKEILELVREHPECAK